MWLVIAIGAMAYIQLATIEIGVGVESGDGAKFCGDYCCYYYFTNKLQ